MEASYGCHLGLNQRNRSDGAFGPYRDQRSDPTMTVSGVRPPGVQAA